MKVKKPLILFFLFIFSFTSCHKAAESFFFSENLFTLTEELKQTEEEILLLEAKTQFLTKKIAKHQIAAIQQKIHSIKDQKLPREQLINLFKQDRENLDSIINSGDPEFADLALITLDQILILITSSEEIY